MKTVYLSSLLCTNIVTAFTPTAVLTKSRATTGLPVSLSEETVNEVKFGKNHPSFSNQHLYGLEDSTSMSVTMDAEGKVVDKDADSLPLPDTYITCGKCKSLFAIAEEDLGTRGKGCRVRCTVCENEWYQSRDRLLRIPTNTHDLLPANPSELNRIARNLSHGEEADYAGVGKLYVGNLDFGTTGDDLLEFFEGNLNGVEVCDATVITNPEGRSRGFAFVSFYDESGGEKALELNGVEWNGRELTVKTPNN